MIATEWSLKKTALLFNHATCLMDQEPGSGAKRKQKAHTVHQGALSMLNEHKNLLHLDEELRKLKRPDNTKRDKKKKIQAMEDAMQAKITELKKQMDVNTTQLDSSSVQALINTIMPQHDAGEGCSGEKGPDKEDSEAEESDSGRSPENCLGENSPEEEEGERESDSGRSDEDCGGPYNYCSDGEKSERDSDSYDEGEQSPRKRQKIINFRVTLFTNLRS